MFTNPNDDGQGKALLDPKTMLLLNISLGDIVLIEGNRKTVAKFCQMPIQDWNQCKIMFDHFTRFNAGVDIGDTVKVSKISEKILAKSVVLAHPEGMPKTIVKFANNPLWLNRLIDFPMLKDDWVPIILNLPNIHSIKFKAVQVEPEAAVIITKETVIKFSDEPADGSGEEYENPYDEVFDNLSNIVKEIIHDMQIMK